MQSNIIAEENEIEIVTVELNNSTLTYLDKLPHIEMITNQFYSFDRDTLNFVMGDLNSHSSLWDYSDDEVKGADQVARDE